MYRINNYCIVVKTVVRLQRNYSRTVVGDSKTLFDKTSPEPDFNYQCDLKNRPAVEKNIKLRKCGVDICRVLDLRRRVASMLHQGCSRLVDIKRQLLKESLRFPNKIFPSLLEFGGRPKVINLHGEKPSFNFKARTASGIASIHLNSGRGRRGVHGDFFIRQVGELQHTLVRYVVKELLTKGFELVAVPDIYPRDVVHGCDPDLGAHFKLVFSLDADSYGEDLCLSGTSEMAIAAVLMNTTFEESQLPLKFAAVSRCYRAETSSIAEERGIYRVHQFTKVEMFGVTNQKRSGELMADFCQLQEHLFSTLGLHTRTLDMPPHELGAAAYRKHDIEAWMPGRDAWGEISSCSDCTDYQARRLSIRYIPTEAPNSPVHAHTVNGTACAVPRMLIALIETHQQEDGTVLIPEPLQPFMRSRTNIGKQEYIPSTKFIRKRQLYEEHVRSV